MASRLNEALPMRIRAALSRRPLRQPQADARLHTLLNREKAPLLLATGPAGLGKSVWCARHAMSRVRYQPVVWCPASELRLDRSDAISTLTALAAHGVDDPARVEPLVGHLRREGLRVLIVLDGIDEVQDFRALLTMVRRFRASALAPHAHLLLTCREEALVDLGPLFEIWWPELLDERDGALIRLAQLERHDVKDFLLGEGATAEQAHQAAASTPPELAGLPLFLTQTLRLIGPPSATSDLRGFLERCSRLMIEDIRGRLTQGGRSPGLRRIERFIADLARAAMASPRQAVDVEAAADMSSDGAEGENTLLNRAVHAGLLEFRGRCVGFIHALYLESFAALAAGSIWPTAWPALASEEGKHVARRVARFIPDPSWLIEAMFSVDPITACECAAHWDAIDPILSGRLIEAIRISLGSRYRSDRLHALKVLGGLRGPEARKAAREWWNGVVASEEWFHYTREAADLFLRLEDGGAVNIVLQHSHFYAMFYWYDPSFLRRLRRTDPAFRSRLVERARAVFRDPAMKSRHGQAITALAMCGETSFVEEAPPKNLWVISCPRGQVDMREAGDRYQNG